MTIKTFLQWRAATGETAFEKTTITDQEISEQEYFDHGVLMVAFVRAGENWPLTPWWPQGSKKNLLITNHCTKHP